MTFEKKNIHIYYKTQKKIIKNTLSAHLTHIYLKCHSELRSQELILKFKNKRKTKTNKKYKMHIAVSVINKCYN